MIQDACEICRKKKSEMPLGKSNKLVCLQCYKHAIKNDAELLKFEQRVSLDFPQSRVEFHKNKTTDSPPPETEEERIKSFCPNCGFGVEVDEDGCCASCGADSMGDGVDMLFDYADDHRAVTKAINEDIDDNPPHVWPEKVKQ